MAVTRQDVRRVHAAGGQQANARPCAVAPSTSKSLLRKKALGKCSWSCRCSTWRSVPGLAHKQLALASRVAHGDGSVRVDVPQCWCGRAQGKRCCVGLFFADEAAVWCVSVVPCTRKEEGSSVAEGAGATLSAGIPVRLFAGTNTLAGAKDLHRAAQACVYKQRCTQHAAPREGTVLPALVKSRFLHNVAIEN